MTRESQSLTIREKGGLNAMLPDLLQTSKYSDFAIRCQENVYHVHKCVICPLSPYFKGVLDGPSKRDQTRVVVELDEEDPVAVWAMVRFFYHGDYDLGPATERNRPRSGDPEQVLHVRVYVLANKCSVGGLGDVALRKYKVCAFVDRGPNFDQSVAEIYRATSDGDRTLKDVVARTVVKHARKVKEEVFRDLLLKIPDLAIDILTMVAEAETRKAPSAVAILAAAREARPKASPRANLDRLDADSELLAEMYYDW